MKPFFRKYVRPFWFSRDCEEIKVPYLYNFIIFLVTVSMAVQLMVMAWLQYPAAVLGAISGAIGIFVGQYFLIIQQYNKVKESKRKNQADK